MAHPTIEGHWWIDKSAGPPVTSHCVQILLAATAMAYCGQATIPLMQLTPALPDNIACPCCLAALYPRR